MGPDPKARLLAMKSPRDRDEGPINAKAAQGTMLKRPGTAEEVSAAILFLASDDASYITGALLFVDDGVTAL